MKSCLGCIVLLYLALLAADGAAAPPVQTPTRDGGKAVVEKKSKQPFQVPEFSDIEQWVNTEPLTMKGLRGRVVVVHFWAFGCVNCQRNLPHYQAWQKDLAGKDLIIVGIHAPETAEEKSVENVAAAVKRLDIKYPVAIDSDLAMWKAWNVRLWPSVGLVDREGRLRHVWEGELNWEGQTGEAQMREHIAKLLAEPQLPSIPPRK